MIIEICANSYQSAVNAEKAGAHRIELCSELGVGGITPSYGLIKQVTDVLTIPVYVLIRPRSGHFVYSEMELDIMKKDILLCKDLGCFGIVSGVLKSDNSIDIEKTNELIELARPLSFTFHRAFDCTPNPMISLNQLIDLGVDTILTSGQQATAEKGLDLLKKLKEEALQRIMILPGSGIHPNNIHLFKKAGFKGIHTSASKPIDCKNKNDYFGIENQTESDISIIKAILDISQA